MTLVVARFTQSHQDSIGRDGPQAQQLPSSFSLIGINWGRHLDVMFLIICWVLYGDKRVKRRQQVANSCDG